MCRGTTGGSSDGDRTFSGEAESGTNCGAEYLYRCVVSIPLCLVDWFVFHACQLAMVVNLIPMTVSLDNA